MSVCFLGSTGHPASSIAVVVLAGTVTPVYELIAANGILAQLDISDPTPV
jgi:hypothetical protein